MFIGRLDDQCGFTLIELLVTIVVAAIIASLAAPSFSRVVASQQLNLSARELASTFSQARAQAALLRREVTVTLNDTTPNTATNFYWAPAANSRLDAPSTVPAIVFTPNGTLKDTAANVAFTDTDFVICNTIAQSTKTIVLTRMGLKYTKPDGSCS